MIKLVTDQIVLVNRKNLKLRCTDAVEGNADIVMPCRDKKVFGFAIREHAHIKSTDNNFDIPYGTFEFPASDDSDCWHLPNKGSRK